MGRVFLISDPHFGHENVAKKRGFDSIEQHDNFMVSNWNKVVHKNDKVFVFGDITMEKKKYDILDKLNGNKTFILGNHDLEQNSNDLCKYGKVAGLLKYKGFWLSHCPIHPDELRGKKNIHGHNHRRRIRRFWFFTDKRYINVSMDLNNYTPVLFNDIIKKYKK
jgi:calcineurin-like phosphoesterase family protein